MKFSIFEDDDDLFGSVQRDRSWFLCSGGRAMYCVGEGVAPDGTLIGNTRCVDFPRYDGLCGGGTYFLTIPELCPPSGCWMPPVQTCCCADDGDPWGAAECSTTSGRTCPACPPGTHQVQVGGFRGLRR